MDSPDSPALVSEQAMREDIMTATGVRDVYFQAYPLDGSLVVRTRVNGDHVVSLRAALPGKFTVDEEIRYIQAIIAEQQKREKEKHGRASAELRKTVAEMTIPEFNAIWKSTGHPPGKEITPEQKELDSYNEIYGRDITVADPRNEGAYTFWRTEYEATGAAYAMSKMMESYRHGDEERWELYLKGLSKYGIKPPREHKGLKRAIIGVNTAIGLALLAGLAYLIPWILPALGLGAFVLVMLVWFGKS